MLSKKSIFDALDYRESKSILIVYEEEHIPDGIECGYLKITLTVPIYMLTFVMHWGWAVSKTQSYNASCQYGSVFNHT